MYVNNFYLRVKRELDVRNKEWNMFDSLFYLSQFSLLISSKTGHKWWQ